jgi:hypothetical protein
MRERGGSGEIGKNQKGGFTVKPNNGEAKQDFLSRCRKQMVSDGKESDQAFAMCNLFWDNERGQRSALTLSAPFNLANKGLSDGNSFLITAYTGAIIERGWLGKTIIDVAGISAKEKFPILREHQRDRIVGIGGKAWNEGKNFFVRGDFIASTDGKEVRDLAAQGFPWQASVGIWPSTIKIMESDQESMEINGQKIVGPIEVWSTSQLGEVSFVALGADSDTAAITFAEREKVDVKIDRSKTAGKYSWEAEQCLAEAKNNSRQRVPFFLKLVDVYRLRHDVPRGKALQQCIRLFPTEYLAYVQQANPGKEISYVAQS